MIHLRVLVFTVTYDVGVSIPRFLRLPPAQNTLGLHANGRKDCESFERIQKKSGMPMSPDFFLSMILVELLSLPSITPTDSRRQAEPPCGDEAPTALFGLPPWAGPPPFRP